MLAKLVARVARSPPVVFTADDLYRVCVVVKSPKDILDLKDNTELLSQLASQYKQLNISSIPPFQKSLLDDVLLPHLSDTTSATESDSTSNNISSSSLAESTAKDGAAVNSGLGQPNALECLTAIWSLIDEAAAEKSDFSGDRMRSLEAYMKGVETQLRQLSPTETASLAKALAKVHYRNYQHTALMARRSCEVASQLSHQDACLLYFNLTKLQSMDSLMPLARRIMQFESELSAKEVHLVAQSLERQSNTSFAGGKLLNSVLARAAAVVSNTKSPSFHRSLFSSAARYNLNRNESLEALLRDLSRFNRDAFQIKDVTVLLRSLTSLEVPGTHPVYTHLVDCITENVNKTLEVRQIDSVIDILSEAPVNAAVAMRAIMTRLEKDAGKLTIPQLANTLQLLSSYPPARGQVCVVSLSFAAMLRSDSIEQAVLEDVLVSLAQLEHFTDDFFGLVKALFSKGGFRKYETLHTVLSHCPAVVLHSIDGEGLVRQGILQLAPVLNDQELNQCRKLLTEKGINDKALHQRVLSRAKQLQRGTPMNMADGRGRGAGGRRRHYDPMDDLIQ